MANVGIMHLAAAPGARPFCNKRNAHMSTDVKSALRWPRICVKCLASLKPETRAQFECREIRRCQ